MLFIDSIFIFLFLPLFGIAYFIIYHTKPNYLSLLFSVAACVFVFYCGVIDGFVFLCSIICNYLIAVYLREKILIIVSIIFNLSLLFYFKYADFILSNIGIPHSQMMLSATIPLGISFYTFHQIAFANDLYKKKIDTIPIFRDYFAFVGFFPQLIAGPIVRARQFFFQFKTGYYLPKPTLEIITVGLGIFFLGAFKKLIIADGMAKIINDLFITVSVGTSLSTLDAWLAAIGFTVQILFDFSGYSEMAIGLGLIFGIVLPYNFNSPYHAYNIQDFWRRWHITLSQFFRDYLYIPVGGNRSHQYQTIFNLLFVMSICGLWHGAGWNFVVWGGMHGAALSVRHCFVSFNRKIPTFQFYAQFSWLCTFTFIILTWVMFRSNSVNDAMRMYKYLLHSFSIHTSLYPSQLYTIIFLSCLGLLIEFVLPSVPILLGLDKINLEASAPLLQIKIPNVKSPWKTALLGMMLFIVFSGILIGTYQPFIYFRF